MNMKKVLKVVGIAFAGYAYGVMRTAYRTARKSDYKKTTEEFADSWDDLRSFLKGEFTTTEEVAEAAEEVAEAVEEAVSEVVPDIEVTTNDSEEESDQPED
jgi:predicted DNA-binding ArsR family transcriptional regulator